MEYGVEVPTRQSVLALVKRDALALARAELKVDELRRRRDKRILWAASLPVVRDDGREARPSRRALGEAAGMTHGNVQHILRAAAPESARIGTGRGTRLFDRQAVTQ